MRSPGQHMIIKIRCCFRKCGQEGGCRRFRGKEGPLASAQAGLLPPGPHPPQTRFFQGDGQALWRDRLRASQGSPGAVGEWGRQEKMRARPEDSRAVGKRHGERARRKGRAWSAGTLLLACGRASEGGGGTVRLFVCSLRREESMRGRDVSPPGPSRHDGGRHGQAAVAPSPSCQNGMSSRSIPGRWPCP